MRALLACVTRKAVETTRAVASQVVVSVTATACVALITHAYFKAGPEPASPSTPRLVGTDPHSAANLLDAAFTANGFRVRSPHPSEFASVFGPSPERAFVSLTSTEWSLLRAEAVPAHQIAPALAESRTAVPKVRRAVTVARACPDDCPRPAAVAGQALPPSRVAPGTEGAQARPRPDASETDDHGSLLGMPLPGVVAAGGKIVETVASWGGSLTGLAQGFR